MLDTRKKIIDAPAHGVFTKRTKAWVGYFDPLHAAHSRRLGELVREGEYIVAVVANPRDPLLPLRARAELVAGLSAICSVIAAGDDVDSVIAGLPEDSVIDDRRADQAWRTALMEHVVVRQNSR